MAEFLTTSGISYQIERIILGAKKNLVLVSPYLQLSKTFFERIKDASNKQVRVVIVYGKDELKQEERDLLASLKGIELYYFQNLHAKCYFNDSSMVITSMNMYEFSLQNNREMGIYLQKEEDSVMFRQAVEETSSIIKSAEKKEFKKSKPEKLALRQSTQEIASKGGNKPGAKKKSRNSGYCIRCMESIPFNPERPYCWECFSIWSVYENYEYEENVCHQCGTTEGTSMNKPECYDCYTGGW